MEVIATALLLLGSGGLTVIAVRAGRGNTAIQRYRYKSYAAMCADVRRERRRLDRFAQAGRAA